MYRYGSFLDEKIGTMIKLISKALKEDGVLDAHVRVTIMSACPSCGCCTELFDAGAAKYCGQCGRPFVDPPRWRGVGESKAEPFRIARLRAPMASTKRPRPRRRVTAKANA